MELTDGSVSGTKLQDPGVQLGLGFESDKMLDWHAAVLVDHLDNERQELVGLELNELVEIHLLLELEALLVARLFLRDQQQIVEQEDGSLGVRRVPAQRALQQELARVRDQHELSEPVDEPFELLHAGAFLLASALAGANANTAGRQTNVATATVHVVGRATTAPASRRVHRLAARLGHQGGAALS